MARRCPARRCPAQYLPGSSSLRHTGHEIAAEVRGFRAASRKEAMGKEVAPTAAPFSLESESFPRDTPTDSVRISLFRADLLAFPS